MKHETRELSWWDYSKELSWWDFVELYNKSEYQSVDLCSFLIPNASGYNTPGSPMGMTTLSKREWNKLMKGSNK